MALFKRLLPTIPSKISLQPFLGENKTRSVFQVQSPLLSGLQVTQKSFTASSKMSSKSDTLMDLFANRRSYYSLNNTSPIPESAIQEIIRKALLTIPSAFNSQTTRIVLLLHSEHHKLWDITTSVLRAKMGEERFSSSPTPAKINGFRAGYGSVLFLEDQEIVSNLKANFKNYEEHFEGWSEHTSGMHQLAVWTALEAEGLGANLQHYNPVIDKDVRETWNLPETWKLRAQLVFGGIEGERPAPKDKKPSEETFKVFGA